MTLHLGLSRRGQDRSHSHSSQERDRKAEQQRDTREAKKFLKEEVRTDWYYLPLPAHRTPKENAAADRAPSIAGFRVHDAASGHSGGTVNGVADELGFEPVEWREREYSDDAVSEDDEDVMETQGVTKRMLQSEKNKTQFRFEGPDSVGPQMSNRRLARKRKRQKALDEEVVWNDGLAHWMARRDLWCCARTFEQVHAMRPTTAPSQVPSPPSAIAASTSSANSTPRSSTSTGPGSTAEAPASPATSPDPVSYHPSLPQPPSIKTTTTAANDALPPSTPTSFEPPPSDHLLPLAPALLPNNAIRARINPQTYPEIYSKIILQSRTPSVPINLGVLTRAIVHGWIADGEWPPKGEAVAPVPEPGTKKGGKVKGGVRQGVRALGKALGVGGSGDTGIVAGGGKGSQGAAGVK